MAHTEEGTLYFIPLTEANRQTSVLIRGGFFEEKPDAPEVWEYKRVNGTAYRSDTAPEVIRILEDLQNDQKAVNEGLRKKARRVIIEYGDPDTGFLWGDKLSGYIGRSKGPAVKVPLIVYSNRSIGGERLHTENILRIVTAIGKKALYIHPLMPSTDAKPV